MSNDPRFGLPSASSMQRLVECPASHAMQAAAPQEKEVSQEAMSGTKIHAALAGENIELTDAEDETMDMCANQQADLLAEWASLDLPPLGYVEQRLGLTALGTVVNVNADCKASLVFTGQADAVYVDGDRALVIDFKTGRGDTAAAVDNAQLASLAVLVWRRYKVKQVRVAIVQPWAGKPTIADYTENALVLAHSWLLETLRTVETATPQDTRAGEWCKYCRAQAGCEAFKLHAIQQVEIIDPLTIAGMNGEDQRKAMFARAMELTPEQITGAWRGLKMIERYVDAIAGAFKSRVEAGEVPGFKIEIEQGNREIEDAQSAFVALQSLGVTSEDMLEAASIAIGKLEDAVRIRSGIKSQTEKRTTYNLTSKDAKAALNAALEQAGCLSRKADKKKIIETTNQIEP